MQISRIRLSDKTSSRLSRATPSAASATPERPACPSRASGWSVIPDLTTLWGFPCCARFPCLRAVAITPGQRLGVVVAHLPQPYQPSPITLSGRPAHRPFRGLLSVHSRAARTLAPSPICDQLHRRLQPFCLLHDCSGCFRLEQLPGGACTHWKAPPSHGAHVKRTLQNHHSGRRSSGKTSLRQPSLA